MSTGERPPARSRPPAPARGRPRSTVAGRRIAEAAQALLREGGPAAVTIDGVAQRSGVARTTIYRRHADRRALLTAVLDDLLGEPFPPPELDPGAKLRWILTMVEQLLEDGLGRGGVAAVITEADPDFSDALRSRLDDRLAVLCALVQEDVDAGRVAGDVDADALVGLLAGAYLGEVLRFGRARPGTLDGLADLLTRAVTPR